jgi:hypothetical protein
MRRFLDLAALFNIAAADEMLAHGLGRFHSTAARDFAKARTGASAVP